MIEGSYVELPPKETTGLCQCCKEKEGETIFIPFMSYEVHFEVRAAEHIGIDADEVRYVPICRQCMIELLTQALEKAKTDPETLTFWV